MGLTALLLLPIVGGLLALVAAKPGGNAERWISVASMAAMIPVVIWLVVTAPEGRWMAEHRSPWAPSIGVSIILALDGLSAALVAVAAGLGIVSVVASWREITHRSGLFHLCLCWTVAASVGVFVAFDLLVFAFFWEAMLVPSFLLIALWGHGEREAAALKFLVFNAVAGLGLLAAVFAMGAGAESITFDAFALALEERPLWLQLWLLSGFSLAFLVKLLAPPFHAWLPDAHTQAPTAGSILLAGLLLKTGAYGLFRFPPMLFPEATVAASPFALTLGAVGALYGGLLACGQHDAKRLVAFTSVAHMSLVLMGLGAGVELAVAGAGVEMIAHAFSSAALFLLIGALYERTHSRDLRELGGLQREAPRFAAAFAFFFAAALAMPGTANFVGEALVITGLFQVNWVPAALALVSLVISVVYATRLIRGIAFGPPKPGRPVADLEWRELAPAAALAAATVLFGLLPQLLVGFLEPAVDAALAPWRP